MMVPLFALVSMSVAAVPKLVTAAAALIVTAPALSVAPGPLPVKSMFPAVVVKLTMPVPAEMASGVDNVMVLPAVSITLPLLVVTPVVDTKPVDAPTVPSEKPFVS